jgi:DNA-binding CsgD family transcriptional regulator
MLPDLIDRIYESAFAPELWPRALDGLAGLADARGGVLFALGDGMSVPRWVASESLHSMAADFFADSWQTRGRRLLVVSPHAGFVTEQSTDEELSEQPMYRDFLYPRGLGRGAGAAFLMPTGNMVVVSVERDLARGRVEPDALHRLDALRPHLARSALLAARLQLERARTVSQTLGALGLPTIVFNLEGAALAANSLVEGLTDQIRWGANNRVALNDPGADAQFREAIAMLDAENAVLARSFAVRGACGAAQSVAHVIPIRGAARDIFTRSAGVLVLTPVAPPHAPPAELVRSLFDLTPAEAHVARRLVAGETVTEIALAGGVSVNTVRSQVRGVLEKTGCRRQTEFLTLMGGLSALPG